MIITITLNPSVDYYMNVGAELLEEEINRSKSEIVKVGGKGINVSRLLSALGIENKCIAVCGGFNGDFIRQYCEKMPLVTFKNIEIEGNTRITVQIQGDVREFRVNGAGPSATESTKENILNALDIIEKDDIVMICGSKTKGLDNEFVLQMCDKINAKGAKLVIDMDPMTLEILERTKPLVIKPNMLEFEKIVGAKDLKFEDIGPYVDKILDTGLENVLISLGKNGAYLASKTYAYKLSQPVIKAVNVVGCGDSMLSTFIGKLYQGYSMEDALKYGTSAGCASAMTFDDVTPEAIEELYKQMTVEKVK